MPRFSHSWKRNTAGWLRQGVSPRRLALTLALGFAIGCIPVVGAPTAVCALLAVGLRLNLPAIQAANYAAMPLQVALIVPFVRLGGWLMTRMPHMALAFRRLAPMQVHFFPKMFQWALQGLVAWTVIAAPTVILLTLALIPLLRRIPALSAEHG